MRGPSFSYDEWVLALTGDVEMRGGTLSDVEAELAGALLRRATPAPRLEWPILKAIWDRRLIRMNPMELWFIDEFVFRTNGTPRVLLSLRPDNDPYFPGRWHNPGNYVGGGEIEDENVVGAETVREACERCALKETGAPLKNCTLIGVGDFANLSRDPELSLIFLGTLGGIPRISDTLQWFSVNALPENMMKHSKAMLEQRVIPHTQLVTDVQKMHPDAQEALRKMLALMQPLWVPANEVG